jgi:hypothetical protein
VYVRERSAHVRTRSGFVRGVPATCVLSPSRSARRPCVHAHSSAGYRPRHAGSPRWPPSTPGSDVGSLSLTASQLREVLIRRDPQVWARNLQRFERRGARVLRQAKLPESDGRFDRREIDDLRLAEIDLADARTFLGLVSKR